MSVILAPTPPPPPPPPPQPPANIEIPNVNGKLLADIRKGIKLKHSNVSQKDNTNLSINSNKKGTSPLDLNNNDNNNEVGTLTKKNPKMALVHDELQQKLKQRNENPDEQTTIIPNQILSPSLALFVQNKTKPLQRQASSDDSKVAGQMIGHGGRNFTINRKFNKIRTDLPKDDLAYTNGTKSPNKQEIVSVKPMVISSKPRSYISNGTVTYAKPEIETETKEITDENIFVEKNIKTEKQEVFINLIDEPIKHDMVVNNLENVPPNYEVIAVHRVQSRTTKEEAVITNTNTKRENLIIKENYQLINETEHIASENDDSNLVEEASRLCKGLVNSPMEYSKPSNVKNNVKKSNFIQKRQQSINSSFQQNTNDLPIEVIERTVSVEEIKKNFKQNIENNYDNKIKNGFSDVHLIKHQISINTDEYDRSISPRLQSPINGTRQKSPTIGLPINGEYVQLSNTMSLKRPKAQPPTNLKISHGKPNFIMKKSPPRDNLLNGNNTFKRINSKSPPMIHLTEINMPPQSYPETIKSIQNEN